MIRNVYTLFVYETPVKGFMWRYYTFVSPFFIDDFCGTEFHGD